MHKLKKVFKKSHKSLLKSKLIENAKAIIHLKLIFAYIISFIALTLISYLKRFAS